MFSKSIDRNIRGVIKIGQEAEDIKKQELEEYVVTDELQDHFRKFFQAYVDSINKPTDATGVWISGFFGSGKSHFLKILSYLLQNSLISGKRPIDYFIDDHKIKDSETLELIEKSEQVPTDVILFNIDAKADANASSDKSAILTVFLRVFNEQLGYDSDPVVANLERWLDQHGYYEAFQDAFYSIASSHWIDVRNSFGFIKNSVKQALIKSGAMDEANASDFLSNTSEYKINPEEFAGMVRAYLDKKGNNHHVIFLADEVGQFIGDNGDRMLNLQTIVEQLQTQCQGRAWVVVTSQQQIDEVTANFTSQKREDLSKIQGRFNTMINMSSANADEVIQKRLLSKTPAATDQLTALFEDNKYNINNKINFSDQVNRKRFENENDFAVNYPFVPYQFDLLKDVLGAVRKHGAEGKHMSDGERSLLATFQAATCHYEDKKAGFLIPFSAFFSGMYEFLSHDHQVVFTKAIGNESVCPNGNRDTLAMQVLEVLFMVKYVDSFPATLENITTLLFDGIFSDREALSNKVKQALNVLIEQKYIQQNVDTYEFLTDKEQDINETISSYDVDDTDIINRIGDTLIGDKFISNKFAPKDKNNQYVFNFNVYIDGSSVGRAGNSQSLRIVTPLNPSDSKQYKMAAQSGNTVVLVLPENDRYISAFRRSGQISQYLQRSVNNQDNQENAIRSLKQVELSKLQSAAKESLQNDVNGATIYVMNDVLDDNTDIMARLKKAYQEVIDTNYRYLTYLTHIESSNDIQQLLKNGHDQNELLNDNPQAVQAVVDYLKMKTNQGLQAQSMESIRKHFGAVPYGYNDEDIAWLVAKAFVDGKIRLAFNNEPISLEFATKNANQVVSYLTKKQLVRKLTLQSVREVPEKQKKAARDFVKDILQRKSILTESKSTEQLAENIVEQTGNKLRELNDYNNSFKQGPGQTLLRQGIDLLTPIANSKDNSERIFTLISTHLDDLEDWLEDMDEDGITDFYHSDSQQKIWRRSQDYVNRYELAKGFIDSDSSVHRTVESIENNLKKQNISSVIPQLEALNENFANEFSDLVDQLYQNYQKQSADNEKTLLQRLADANLPSPEAVKLEEKIKQKFSFNNKAAREKSGSGKYTELNDQIQLLNRDVNFLQRLIDQTSQRVAEEIRKQQLAVEQQEQISSRENDDKQASSISEAQAQVVHVKRVKSVKISELESQSWRITSQDDLDNYIDKLKKQLKNELNKNDIVNVDFK